MHYYLFILSSSVFNRKSCQKVTEFPFFWVNSKHTDISLTCPKIHIHIVFKTAVRDASINSNKNELVSVLKQ